jgi:hypothetical protein
MTGPKKGDLPDPNILSADNIYNRLKNNPRITNLKETCANYAVNVIYYSFTYNNIEFIVVYNSTKKLFTIHIPSTSYNKLELVNVSELMGLIIRLTS